MPPILGNPHLDLNPLGTEPQQRPGSCCHGLRPGKDFDTCSWRLIATRKRARGGVSLPTKMMIRAIVGILVYSSSMSVGPKWHPNLNPRMSCAQRAALWGVVMNSWVVWQGCCKVALIYGQAGLPSNLREVGTAQDREFRG